MSKQEWVKMQEHPGDWYEIRATFDRLLTDAEVWAASGCIGYALREVLHGERLSDPLRTKRKGDGRTTVRYGYDSTKAQADDRDDCEAFRLAAVYVVEGSPVRTTDRAGLGTRGTRLAQGIGPVGVTFEVR